ncbi:PqqD family peptide modification chaperone [Phenylobacterium deserti]|uniref:Serine kinase n=1 Tax=Phenylobacterium deserti TaxID=1914756 RepID=A0A328APP3_9CAUL|nr:PqqD family peptide modification chaperone [Phenylobacterium deserti]RAK56549.1 hypothetical protein DJ018_00770 [Phenylobacterium deserti]
MFELNATADLIWRGLADGGTPGQVAKELQTFGVSAQDAQSFVAECVAGWLHAGLLIPAQIVEQAQSPGRESHLRIAGLACTVAIHAPAGDPLPSRLEAVFGQFAAPPSPGTPRFDIVEQAGAYVLLADGAPLGVFAPERIVPEIKAVLTDRLAKSVGDGDFLIHAALLSANRQGLLISGAPGAGKTTLTLALAARGLGYGSDDVVRVVNGERLEGVPFSPASKSGAWELAAPYLPMLADLPIDVRGDQQRVRYAPVSGFGAGEVEQLSWVILLARRPAASAMLEPVEPLFALTELLGSAFAGDGRLKGDVLERFAAQLNGARCLRLIYSDLADGVSALEGLTRG